MDNVGVSVFGFWGPEGNKRGQESGETADRMQVGGILDVQATDQLELVLEGYYGNQADYAPGSANARWNGVAGYAIYDFNDQWGLHVRAEVFEDAAGYFSCGGSDSIHDGDIIPLGNAQVCPLDGSQTIRHYGKPRGPCNTSRLPISLPGRSSVTTNLTEIPLMVVTV